MSVKRYTDALPFIESINALREAIDDATSAIIHKSGVDLTKRIPYFEPIQPDTVKVIPFTKAERKKVSGFGKDAVVKIIETERGKCAMISPSPGVKATPIIKSIGIKDATCEVIKLVKGVKDGKRKLYKVAHYKSEGRDAACPPPKPCKRVKMPKC